MKFCPKCKSMMLPKNKDGKKILDCTGCDYEEALGSNNVSMKETVTKEKKIEVFDQSKENENLPTTNEEKCPKCENQEAYYWIIQTRAGDESPTKFMRCTKCGHTWRDYS